MKKIWFRVGMEVEISDDELMDLQYSEELMKELISRAKLSGETYIPEKYNGCEEYDNPDSEINFLF